MFPLISVTLFLPLLGAAILVAARGASPRTAHAVGIVTSGLTLIGALLVWARGVGGVGFSQVEEVAWIPLSVLPTAWAWTESACRSS